MEVLDKEEANNMKLNRGNFDFVKFEKQSTKNYEEVCEKESKGLCILFWMLVTDGKYVKVVWPSIIKLC